MSLTPTVLRTLVLGGLAAAAVPLARTVSRKLTKVRGAVWKKHKATLALSDSKNTPVPAAVTHSFGNVVYIPAIAGTDAATGSVVSTDPAEQARAALAHLTRALTAAGSSPAHVLKCSVLLTDMAHFAAVNAVYAETFPQAPPARACYAVANPAPAVPGALIAVEAYAATADADATATAAAAAQCPFIAKQRAAAAAAGTAPPAEAPCPHPLPKAASPVAHPATEAAPAAIGPYSQCSVLKGSGIVFVSGQVRFFKLHRFMSISYDI